MKGAILILAVIASVALAVPARQSRRDVSEVQKQEPAANEEAPEVQAKVEEARQDEPKPARNATARAQSAAKNQTSEAESSAKESEVKTNVEDLLEAERPVNDESEAEPKPENSEQESAQSEDLIAAPIPSESAEEIQDDQPAPAPAEDHQEAQLEADAASAEKAEANIDPQAFAASVEQGLEELAPVDEQLAESQPPAEQNEASTGAQLHEHIDSIIGKLHELKRMSRAIAELSKRK